MMVNKKLRKENVTLKVLATVNVLVVLLLVPGLSAAEKLVLDERPVGGGEWGYRPSEGTVSAVNPPSFSWRPQKVHRHSAVREYRISLEGHRV
jgi:hypothetical protein